MMNKIKYQLADRTGEFTIMKFRAIEALDFVIDMLNELPETLNLGEQSTLHKDTIKYIIFSVMDVGEDIKISDEQKKFLEDVAQIDLISLLFKEAYTNAPSNTREHFRQQLLELLRMENGDPVTLSFDMLIKTPKAMFSALSNIVKYNYEDFFLITGV